MSEEKLLSPRQIRLPKFSGATPACFNAKQYDLWKQKAREAIPGQVGPCADCTPTYKVKMHKQGRCEREVIRFRWDEDGMVEGFLPPLTLKEKLIRKIELEIAREKAAAKI